jgi:hypothetical protein
MAPVEIFYLLSNTFNIIKVRDGWDFFFHIGGIIDHL